MTTRWGILATGRIARTLANAVVASDSSELAAVGSRTQAAAVAFASDYDGITAHGSYDALLEDDDVDAIYISTPHPQHAEWTIKALEAGKAVLCEKPMGVNHAEVMAMVETAAFHNRFLMEAFMYRTHPQTAKAIELIRDGAIGEVRQVNASHGFASPFNPASRLHSNDLAGGGIMDVGCYPVSMARLIAGEEPDAVAGFATLGETGVDRWACALLKFPGGLIARVSTAVSLSLDNTVQVFGSRGSMHITSPWFADRGDGKWQFDLVRAGKREAVSAKTKPTYVLEVDEVARAIASGDTESQSMSWQDSLGNAKALDRWRAEAGVVFELEQPERQTTPVHGRPLSVRRKTMRHGMIAGLDKPVSKLVMGCDNQPNAPHAAVMFDNYFEYAGNTFDTAHIYGGGRMEALLGSWIANRGVREDVVVIGKGAHTPANFPDRVGPQLDVSLGRLQTDYVDLYFLHRDNVGRAGGRMDRRAERRASSWANPRVRGIELVSGPCPGRQRARRGERLDAVRRRLQQLQSGPHGRSGLAGLHRGIGRRMAHLAHRRADAVAAVVEPGTGIFHAALRRRASGCRLRHRCQFRQSAERPGDAPLLVRRRQFRAPETGGGLSCREGRRADQHRARLCAQSAVPLLRAIRPAHARRDAQFARRATSGVRRR